MVSCFAICMKSAMHFVSDFTLLIARQQTWSVVYRAARLAVCWPKLGGSGHGGKPPCHHSGQTFTVDSRYDRLWPLLPLTAFSLEDLHIGMLHLKGAIRTCNINGAPRQSEIFALQSENVSTSVAARMNIAKENPRENSLLVIEAFAIQGRPLCYAATVSWSSQLSDLVVFLPAVGSMLIRRA